MNVSFIIVTYNNEDTIYKCISSIKKQDDIGKSEIIVVDNSSKDGTINELNKFEGLKVIESKSNLGFGNGNNLAFKKALGKYIVLVNPDAYLNEKSTKELLKTFVLKQNVGIVGGNLKGENYIQPFPSFTGIWNIYRNKLKLVSGNNPIQEVPWVCGAYCAYERKTLLRFGGFDTRFFLYYEETDLCKSMHEKGFKTYINRKAIAEHEGGGSAKKEKEGIDTNNKMIPSFKYKAQLLFYRKHYGLLYTLICVILESFIKVITVIKRIRTHSDERRIQKKEAINDLKELIKAMCKTRLGMSSPKHPWSIQ